MMISAELATTVVSLLAPYLMKAGEEVAKKAGDAAWQKIGEIHKAIRARFKQEKDSFPKETLKSFEKDPEKRKEALKELLVQMIEEDKAFADLLSKLVEEAKGRMALAGPSFATNVFGGEVGEIINVNSLKELNINKSTKASRKK